MFRVREVVVVIEGVVAAPRPSTSVLVYVVNWLAFAFNALSILVLRIIIWRVSLPA